MASEPAAPSPKRVKSESSYTSAPSAPPPTAAPATVSTTGLNTVEGLVGLVAHLPPRSQTAAYQWCVESDTWSVAVIVELGQEEAILAALGLKPGGNSELIVRKRLSNFRA